MNSYLIGSKRLMFLGLMLSLVCAKLNAQDDQFNKNAIYISYGNIIFEDQISIAYERSIFEKNKFRTKAKAVFGNYLSNNFDYDEGARRFENYIGLSGVQLIGLLELNAGLAFATFKLAPGFNPSPDVDYEELRNTFIFYGSLGIRYEKNRFLVRAGINNIELLYAGLGITF